MFWLEVFQTVAGLLGIIGAGVGTALAYVQFVGTSPTVELSYINDDDVNDKYVVAIKVHNRKREAILVREIAPVEALRCPIKSVTTANMSVNAHIHQAFTGSGRLHLSIDPGAFAEIFLTFASRQDVYGLDIYVEWQLASQRAAPRRLCHFTKSADDLDDFYWMQP